MKGVVECLKVVTAEKSYRIAKFAFDYATRHNRKKVSIPMHSYLIIYGIIVGDSCAQG